MSMQRDHKALEKLRAEVKQGGCPNLIFDDNGKWAVSDAGTQPMEWPLTHTTVFLDEVKWFDHPADAILFNPDNDT